MSCDRHGRKPGGNRCSSGSMEPLHPPTAMLFAGRASLVSNVPRMNTICISPKLAKVFDMLTSTSQQPHVYSGLSRIVCQGKSSDASLWSVEIPHLPMSCDAIRSLFSMLHITLCSQTPEAKGLFLHYIRLASRVCGRIELLGGMVHSWTRIYFPSYSGGFLSSLAEPYNAHHYCTSQSCRATSGQTSIY